MEPPQTIAGWAGWVTSSLLGLFVAWTQFRKGRVDESAVVLAEWKKLIDAHQSQIKSLVDEVADLRRRLGVTEGRVTVLEDENRSLRIENDGLRRQVAQRSQSEVEVLGAIIGARSPTARRRFLNDPDRDLLQKLDDQARDDE